MSARRYTPVFRTVCTSTKLAEVRGDAARLYYLLALAAADSWGRLPGDAARSRLAVWPALGKTQAETEAAIVEVCRVNLLVRYVGPDGEVALAVPDWEGKAGSLTRPERRGLSAHAEPPGFVRPPRWCRMRESRRLPTSTWGGSSWRPTRAVLALAADAQGQDVAPERLDLVAEIRDQPTVIPYSGMHPDQTDVGSTSTATPTSVVQRPPAGSALAAADAAPSLPALIRDADRACRHEPVWAWAEEPERCRAHGRPVRGLRGRVCRVCGARLGEASIETLPCLSCALSASEAGRAS